MGAFNKISKNVLASAPFPANIWNSPEALPNYLWTASFLNFFSRKTTDVINKWSLIEFKFNEVQPPMGFYLNVKVFRWQKPNIIWIWKNKARIIFVVFSRIFFVFWYFTSRFLCDFLELEKMSKPSLLSASDLHRVHTMAVQQESSSGNSSAADNDKRKKNKYLRSAMSMDTRSTPIETPTTSATSATAVTSSMSRSSSGSKVGGNIVTSWPKKLVKSNKSIWRKIQLIESFELHLKSRLFLTYNFF